MVNEGGGLHEESSSLFGQDLNGFGSTPACLMLKRCILECIQSSFSAVVVCCCGFFSDSDFDCLYVEFWLFFID